MLFGVSLAFLLPNLPKIVSVWFPPQEGGFASGIYVTGLGLGMTIGLFSGGVFSSWNQASLVFGVLAFGTALFWTVFGRTAPESEELKKPPIWEGVRRGIKSKSIIGGAVGLFFFLGGLTGFTHLLPHALELTYGKSMATGGKLASMITLGLVIGNVVLPWISDKIRKVNMLIIIGGIIGASLFFTGWLFSGFNLVWIIFVSGGFFAGAIPPLIFEVPAELPHLHEEKIQTEHVAGASGILISLQNFGGFLLPSFVLTYISVFFGFNIFFLTSSIFIGIPALATLLIKETGEIED